MAQPLAGPGDPYLRPVAEDGDRAGVLIAGLCADHAEAVAHGRLTPEEGAARGEAAAARGAELLDEEAWDVLADIPEDTAAALVLLEHRWAIPLRDAVARAGGVRLASEFISPLDLVEVGLVAQQE